MYQYPLWASYILIYLFLSRLPLPYWRFICWWSKFTPSLPSSQILTFFLADYFCSGSLESIAVVIKKGTAKKQHTTASTTSHKTKLEVHILAKVHIPIQSPLGKSKCLINDLCVIVLHIQRARSCTNDYSELYECTKIFNNLI